MLNVRGASVEEVHGHLTALFGGESERADALLESFGTAGAVAVVQNVMGGEVVSQTSAAPVPGAPAQSGPVPGQAPAPAPAPVAGQGQAPPCGLCGAPKNQVNGKFGPFWSCPNWSDDAHKLAKAQGVKF